MPSLVLRAPATSALPARARPRSRVAAASAPRAAGNAPKGGNGDKMHPAALVLPGTNQLETLRSVSRIVIDTGNIDAIAKWKPEDATTNPTLLLKASASARYRPLAHAALSCATAHEPAPGQASGARGPMAGAADALAVAVGMEILKLLPGRVSTEADARLAYDTAGTVEHALRLIALYEAQGVSRERVLIKVASTWEGVRAVETLQKQHGVACNCTLLFSFEQAVACAEAGATLVSPFVGRILDWHVKHEGRTFAAEEDPGVRAVTRVYNYYKRHNYPTTVMAASFRNPDEVRQLVGCDAITLAPPILEALASSTDPLTLKLSPEHAAHACSDERVPAAHTRQEFEAQLGEGTAAREKLVEGVATFSRDAAALEDWLAKLQAGEVGTEEEEACKHA